MFECDCFDCYTNYWFKWDTSVNRELIHQAIEAFEENLNKNENKSKHKSKKKLEKNNHRRFAGKTVVETTSCETKYDVALVESEECTSFCTDEGDKVLSESPEMSPEKNVESPEKMSKGLGKKMIMADVIGLFNWRLWSIWNPNV